MEAQDSVFQNRLIPIYQALIVHDHKWSELITTLLGQIKRSNDYFYDKNMIWCAFLQSKEHNY